MIHNHENVSFHEKLKALEQRRLRQAEDLSDARTYYAEDPSNRNFSLLKAANQKLRILEEEKSELLEEMDFEELEGGWD
jgi:hypothetical protein